MSGANQALLGRYPRICLTVLAGVNVALGAIFYACPGLMIVYWAWPVKELAVRFLGAIFLAISLGCWTALQARLWPRAKILVLVGGTFFSLTGIVSVVTALTITNKVITWLWAGYFLASGVCCIIILFKYRWHSRTPEPIGGTTVPVLSRTLFGAQTSVVGIFGAMMVLLPSLAQEQFWPWKVASPTLQTFGSLFLATCLATGWAFFQRDPQRIVVLLPLDAIFPTLALLAVGISWNVIVSESPSQLVTGVWLFLYSFVAAG
ncbi:MAG TPA: hypothetical protein VE955_02640, partial [Candidatus Dormibacteraeota bacterium]|nr:hypothetical protein [Candidatus Dormibacteraeota bacterium]